MPFSFKPTQVGEVAQAEPIIPPSAPISTTNIPPKTNEFVQNANGNQIPISNKTTNPVPTFATQNRIVVPVQLGAMPLTDRNESDKISIFRIILYVILGAFIFSAIILFSYQRYLISNIDTQKKNLDEKDNIISSIDLEQMRDFSNRIKVVSQVLNEHTSVNTAFIILEKSIENQITYKSFELTKNIINKNYDLKITGISPSYRTLAQQIDVFNSSEFKKDYISNVDYDNPTLDSFGKINFTIKLAVLILGKLPENVFPKPKEVSDIIETGTTTAQKATSTEMIKASTTPN